MYVAGNFEAENSLILVVTMVIRQHWRVTVHYYPLTSQILQCCLLRDFGANQFHSKMSCDLEVLNQWESVLYNNTNDHLRENAFLPILPVNSLRNYEDQNLFPPDTPCAEADTLPRSFPQGRWIGLDPYSFPASFKLEFYGLCPQLAAINLIML